MKFAGLDIGTTGCKVTVYREDGEYLGRVYRDYPVQRSHSEHEVDPSAIWSAVKEVLSSAAKDYPGIKGVGVTSFGETFVALGKDGQPLAPAMLYTDPRGEAECSRLVEALGEDFITEHTGIKPHSMYSLPKLMWMKENCPDLYSQIGRVCLIEDYIVYSLTGTAQIDYSLATRTMAFDIHKLAWCHEIFEAAGIEESLFSRPVPTGTSAGPIKEELAKEFGLPTDCVAVSVSHDQVAAAIGSGVFSSDCAVDGAGTVECITPVFQSYDTAKMAAGSYAIVPYIIPGSYVCYAFSFTGGALVKWYTDNLAGYAAAEAKTQNCSLHDLLEEGWKGTPSGLLVLPHFAGAATPYMDPGSKGAILGLGVETTQRDIYRAILEGVTFEMKLNMDRLADAGVTIPALRATGGGANSRVWTQMKADILNVPITALRSNEAGAAGSAMLVGIATGVFPDLSAAAKALVAERETFSPRAEVHERYLPVYENYKKIYDAVRPLV